MRKIILDLATTLDGFIEGPDGEIDWCIIDDDMDFQGFLSSVDTIFYGRVSYDAWGNFEPTQDTSETEKSLWSAIHSKKKYVFSSELREDLNATFITKNLSEKVKRIKSEEGRDIWLYGGAKLIKTFIDLDLIDTFRLSVHPTILGKGKPLFENLKERFNLKLVGLNKFKSGVVQLIYEKG